MNTLRIKSGDIVKVISGSKKGQTGKVTRVDRKTHLVFVDGIGTVKRHVKPSQINPRGGTKDIHVGIPAGKVALVVDEAKGTTSRIGHSTDAKGNKVRVARALKDKEIK